VAVNADTTCGAGNAVVTQRATLNYDMNHEVYAYSNMGAPCTGAGLSLYAQLRGYIESLHSLTPGCIGAKEGIVGTAETPCCGGGAGACAPVGTGKVCFQNGDCLSAICCTGANSIGANCVGVTTGTCK